MYYKILALSIFVLISSTLVAPTITSAQSAAGVIQAPSTPSPTTGYCRPGKDAIVDMPWPNQGQIRPSTDGFLRSTVSFRIRIPTTLPREAMRRSATDNIIGFIRAAEKSGSENVGQITSISKIPCDFNHSPYATDFNGVGGSDFAFGISNELPVGNLNNGYGLNFHPGDVFYVNVTHDLTGYGTMPGSGITNRITCPTGSKCDLLFDFAIPGRGAGFPDLQPNGTAWPQDPAVPGWPIYSSAYNAAHPLGVCAITYGIGNNGTAQMSASNASQYQRADGTVFVATCPGVQAVQAVINQQALQSPGSSATNPGQATGTTQTNLETLTATNSAQATAIIQALAKKEANNGVVVSVGPNGVSTTINGVTFTASTAIELAAKYYQYLQSGQGVSGGAPAGTNAGNTLATSLSVNLAPGDYNPADQVRLLQAFLNSEVAATLTLNGFFNDQTLVGVIKLQNKYASQTYQKAGLTSATGFVGQYTRDLINSKLGVASAGSGSGSGSSGPVVTNYCTGADQIITVPWPASGQVRPSSGAFKDQAIAFKVTVPHSFSPALNINHLGFMRIAEVPLTPVVAREVTVSRNPCDFQSGNYFVSGLRTNDTAPGVNYTVNNPSGSVGVGGQFNLQSGDTVYFNVRNISGSGDKSCSSANCPVLFDFATPNRY